MSRARCSARGRAHLFEDTLSTLCACCLEAKRRLAGHKTGEASRRAGRRRLWQQRSHTAA
jgi:hypothetical protein